ncbi:MAG: hypothetical protein R2788_02815 [Saprospiraceae bacterium]
MMHPKTPTLQSQKYPLSQEKLNQLLLVCTCIFGSGATNLSAATKRMGKVLDEKLGNSTAYSRLKRFFNRATPQDVFRFACIFDQHLLSKP